MSKLEYDIERLKTKASKAEPGTKTLFAKLKKQKAKGLDLIMQDLHHEVFDETDCLACANCCRSLGPRITDKDIDRVSSSLKMKGADFISHYLQIDEDKDYVFKTMPCPFLAADNYCLIYAVRPKACREYPHTDRKKFHQLFNLTLANAYTCPAVYEIIERLKKRV